MHKRRWFGEVAFCTNLIHILHITRPLFFFRHFGSNKPFYLMGFKVLIRFKVTTWYYGVIPENNLIKRLNKLLSYQLKKKWLKCNFYSNIEFEGLTNTVIRFIFRRSFTAQNRTSFTRSRAVKNFLREALQLQYLEAFDRLASILTLGLQSLEAFERLAFIQTLQLQYLEAFDRLASILTLDLRSLEAFERLAFIHTLDPKKLLKSRELLSVEILI